MKEKKHRNIPVFIPHLGCPHSCVFCNQNTISGTKRFDRESVKGIIENTLSTIPSDYTKEIAYFGGSFTGIDRNLMVYLLDTAQEFVNRGDVQSIRLSTRPDYISEEILDILSSYSVKVIELGLQSMDEDVLNTCERGHNSKQAEYACNLIKRRNFELIGQMMIGLPHSNGKNEVSTAEKICAFGADGARIYPTVILKGTKLERMYNSGEYIPASMDEIVKRSCDVLDVLDRHSIPAIRIGLCSSDISVDDVVANTFHPAIGELVESELFFRKINKELSELDTESSRFLTIECPVGTVSKISGQKRKNKNNIIANYHFKDIKIIENSELLGYNIKCIPE